MYNNHVELGKSIPELAAENNVSYDTIRYFLIKFGIEIQKVNQHKFKTEEEIKQIINLYCNEKKSANEISKMFGTSHSVIIRILKENNIEIRDFSES